MKFFRASLETRNFDFEAFGANWEEAREVLRRGFEVHRRQTGAEMTWEEAEESVRMSLLETRMCYRDKGIIIDRSLETERRSKAVAKLQSAMGSLRDASPRSV